MKHLSIFWDCHAHKKRWLSTFIYTEELRLMKSLFRYMDAVMGDNYYVVEQFKKCTSIDARCNFIFNLRENSDHQRCWCFAIYIGICLVAKCFLGKEPNDRIILSHFQLIVFYWRVNLYPDTRWPYEAGKHKSTLNLVDKHLLFNEDTKMSYKNTSTSH